MLTAAEVKLVKDSFPLAFQNKARIGTRTYQAMMERLPETVAMFERNVTAQHHMIVGELALILHAAEVGTPHPSLARLTRQHAGMNLEPRHFAAMRESLVDAVLQEIGEPANAPLRAAWGKAFDLLAAQMTGINAD